MPAVPNHVQGHLVTWDGPRFSPLLMGIVDTFADHTARPGMTQYLMGVCLKPQDTTPLPIMWMSRRKHSCPALWGECRQNAGSAMGLVSTSR